MRENRPYGSEGGGAEFNRLSLPLSLSFLHVRGGRMVYAKMASRTCPCTSVSRRSMPL